MDPVHLTAANEADAELDTNTSGNPHINDLLQTPVTRRQTLSGGLSIGTAALLGASGLAGCESSDPAAIASKLGFAAVPKSRADVVSVPPGYSASVLFALGDPIDAATPEWSDSGSETGASYEKRAGDHHDGLYFFGLSDTGAPSPGANGRGLLAMNHEAMNPFNTGTGANNLYIHPNGGTSTLIDGKRVRNVPDEVLKEVNSHGVAVIEVRKTGTAWAVDRASAFNRRITAGTTMEISGPLRGKAQMRTKFSPAGTHTQGTVNNCASGYTFWGTYLTCEENWAGYFARASDDDGKRPAKEQTSLVRYGNAQGATQRGLWNTAGAGDEFQRWDTSVKGAADSGGIDDFRNVINQFGWVVEIDPYDPASIPRKRTALGRFAHEGAWPANPVAGKPLVFYMGDDSRGEYIYKFVSAANWDPADAARTDRMAVGDKYLDAGKLYVAKFSANGSGSWRELTFGQNGVTAENAAYAFADQDDVALNTRLAADAAGATRMDRPEWGAVSPLTGEVYFTLTNNNATVRPIGALDAANPRFYDDKRTTGASQTGNPNGHIIRLRESSDDPAATSFRWDIYLFGARSTIDPVNVNVSGLVDDNDFSSPDGLWFARPGSAAAGLLWIQTDDGAYTDVTNCMLLAAVPGSVGDGSPLVITSTSAGTTRSVGTFVGQLAGPAVLRRFLVGPKECEVTGIDSTPDGKTLFVNIQHPGEDTAPTFANPSTFGSHWPDSQANPASAKRPRSATIVITKNDGGVIGL